MSIQLISFDGKNWKLTPEAKSFLQAISSLKEIGIVSVIGKPKTGKSFFLNEVVLKTEQFDTSHTTAPCTKGIWVS